MSGLFDSNIGRLISGSVTHRERDMRAIEFFKWAKSHPQVNSLSPEQLYELFREEIGRRNIQKYFPKNPNPQH
jgi:hypothetical protein